jgi:cysteine desulfurase/selenocysteine lyase
VIYMDNAATSWPKPPEVIRAMSEFLERAGGNPGRSGHRLSVAAGRAVYDTREALAEFFNASDPLKVVFTYNATYAINTVLYGFIKPGDTIVATSVEHNAVMRPLRDLEKKGVELIIVQCNEDASLDPSAMEKAVKPGVRLVAVNHASNVTGTILPIENVTHIAHGAGAVVLVDAAQTAGAVPIDVQSADIDFLAFTGHKALLGPTGTGGLVIGENVDVNELEPLTRGGTGSRSEFEVQPDRLPDKYESGTSNALGMAGLKAGLGFIKERGLESIQAHKLEMTSELVDGLNGVTGVTVYGPDDISERTAVVSFTVEGRRVSEIGMRLDEDFGIMARVGLHCAPALHKTIGTFPEGTVRLAPGVFTTSEDVRYTVDAVKRIVKS